MQNTIGIAIVCTNAYFILGIRFIKKFMYHYKGSADIIFYIFTDTDPSEYLVNIPYKYIHNEHKSWVDGTNSKFENIIKLYQENCDYLFYFDADTNITRPFDETWFIGDLVAGEHYNNRSYAIDIKNKPFERNPKSKACVPLGSPRTQTYCYGAFFGGKKDNVINMCKTLKENQIADKLINFEPCWNDESYLNNYFHYHDVTIVPSDKFAFGVSDKGGIGDTRDMKLQTEKYKQILLTQPDKPFELHNKEILFID
ncbi:hypothetical protein EB118_18125 [bacterium]|nr:hypothetical protein [bacterium]NDG31977.1 hypothetical protein [bacterium]